MKTTFNIKIHILYYLFAILSIMTGLFKEFILFNSLIVIHEIGHALMALFLGWKIEKIVLFPFGGLTIFKNSLDKPILEEFIILISGPAIQLIFYFLIQSISYSETLMIYNWGILIFNLLPIYPLDGSKMINLILLKYLPFIKSNLITLYFSLLVLLFAIIGIIRFGFNLLITITLLFLLIKIFKELKTINYTFNYFLLEKIRYNRYYKKKRVINGNKINKIYRDSSHLFFFNNKYHLEKEILRKRFDFISKV